MSEHPVKASKSVAAMAGEPFPKPTRASDRWRALLGIAAGVVVALVGLAHGAGLLPISGGILFAVTLAVSQLQWINLTLARAESAFRRNGRPLRREHPGPGQRALRLSPHTRAQPLYVLEAFSAVLTGLAALLIGAHLLTPVPHPMIYLACASLFAACAIAILFPKFGAR